MRWWKIFCLSILIASALLLNGARAASNESWPNQHKKSTDKEADVAQQRQPEPSVPRTLYNSTQSALHDALIALHAEQEARAKEQHPRYEPIYAPSVLVQIGLLVVGFLYTRYAKRQWLAIKKQTQLIEESLVADKRAFVCADGVTYWWEPIPDSNLFNFRLRPRYKNTGSTPTKNLRSHVECDIRNTMLPRGHVFTDQDTNAGTGMIPPHGEVTGGVAPQGLPITPQDIVESQTVAGQTFRRFIYLWGWIKYNDVFPNTPEHTTHFCWLIMVVGDVMSFVPNTVGQPPTPGTLDFRFLQNFDGNDAD